MKLENKKSTDGVGDSPLKALRERAFGATLHLPGFGARSRVYQQGWRRHGGRGPSQRSLSNLGKVQARNLVAQDEGSD